MGADTKALRTRIKSVDSTLHLTRAMGLVASSKIRRANDAMLRGREYARSLEELINVLCASKECKKSIYMRESNQDRIRLIVIAGDRGLAGGYNSNIFRLVKELPKAEIIPLGKRAHDRFGGEFISSEHFTSSDAFSLAKRLCDDFVLEKYDKLGIVSTKYLSVMAQQPTVKWILPLSAAKKDIPEGQHASVIFEPDEITVFNAAIPEYVAGIISVSVRESFASEVAARRMAMDSAGKNAEQMIDDLRLQYNRARQGSITQEITEIVAGSGR